MRIIILLGALLYASGILAQTKNTGPIKTQKGLELKEGDTLRLGRGTNYDGSFQYVRTGLTLTSTTNDPLPATHANTLAIVRAFRPVRIGTVTKVYTLLKAGTLMPAYADTEAAIDAKEIIAVNRQEIGKPRAKQQNAVSTTLTASTKDNDAGTLVRPDEMTVKPFSNDVDIRILSVEGNKSQQTVTVNFLLKTELPHQQISFLRDQCRYSDVEGKAYDGEGIEYRYNKLSLGSVSNGSSIQNKLPTSVPLKGSITFANTLPKTTDFSFVTFYMSSANFDGGANCQGGNVEIRNAKINWK